MSDYKTRFFCFFIILIAISLIIITMNNNPNNDKKMMFPFLMNELENIEKIIILNHQKKLTLIRDGQSSWTLVEFPHKKIKTQRVNYFLKKLSSLNLVEKKTDNRLNHKHMWVQDYAAFSSLSTKVLLYNNNKIVLDVLFGKQEKTKGSIDKKDIFLRYPKKKNCMVGKRCNAKLQKIKLLV